LAAKSTELCYKGHPLRRKDNLLYYGSMADKYIIMMQILDTKKIKDLDVATRVSVQLQLTDPDLKSRDRVVKKTEKDGLYNAISCFVTLYKAGHQPYLMAGAVRVSLLGAVDKGTDAMVVAMERVRDAGLTNVRFLDRDAALLPEFFAPGEVSRIYINFPDPWPKKKQFKRRLTAPGFQKLYFDLLPPGGEGGERARGCVAAGVSFLL